MPKFPKGVANARQATEQKTGLLRLANATESADTSEAGVAISPKQVFTNYQTLVPAATATVSGRVELATDAEAVAKSDATRALTPANMAASGFLQYADVTLTAAEVKALATTPIELVAAPAAGSAHLFMGASLKLVYGSEVFAESGDNLGIKYTNAAGVQVCTTIECTGFIDQSADTYTNAVPKADVIVAASAAEAAALVLDNLGSNFTGNASDDSTLEIRTYYVTQAL